MLGNWYKQLIGESLGKSYTSLDEKTTSYGFVPVVSVGTTDLHSVAQLYLDGPRTIVTTFVDIKHEKETLFMPTNGFSLSRSVCRRIQLLL